MAFINELAMTRNYVGYSLTEIAHNLISDCFHYGERVKSRNGSCRSLYNIQCCLLNPKARELHLEGRKNSFPAICAELFWVLSGSNKIFPYLSFFLKRAIDYADDKKHWRGGYGKRLWQYNQFESVIKHFKDNLYTRRAIQTIYDASVDNYVDYMNQYNTMLDIPCNNWIQYFVVPKKDVNGNVVNYFCMKVMQRSGDIIWGVTNVNIPIFSTIHEIMFEILKHMYPDENIQLGAYYHEVTDAHLYENDLIMKQVNNIINNYQKNLSNAENDRNAEHLSTDLTGFLYIGKNIYDLKDMAQRVVERCSQAIETKQAIPEIFIHQIEYEYCLSKKSSFYKYLSVVVDYVNQKLEKEKQKCANFTLLAHSDNL